MADPTDTATDPATDTLAVEVEVSSPSACSRTLKITVAADVVDERLEKALDDLQRETVFPGFRKGKVPRKLLERRVGEDLVRDTRDRLLGEAVSAAIRKEEIKPLGEPEFPEDATPPELRRGEAFTLEIEVEVMPEFEIPAYDGIKIRKPVGEVGEDAIDRELERQRRWFGNPERITGPFVEGDRMVGPAKVVKEGDEEPFFTTDDALATVPGEADGGRGQFLGVFVDGLAGILGGRKVGDTVEIETVAPEGHEIPDIRGKQLKISYEIRDAERITPANDEDVAAAFGLPSVEDLRPQVKLALEERMLSEQRAVMREQVAEALVGKVEMDLPEKLSSRQATALVERQRAELLGRGLDPEQLETELARFREGSESKARDQMKLSLILMKAGESFGVSVSEQEINGRIARIARRRGERAEQLRAELEKGNRLGAVAVDIREQKTLDRIIDKAEVSDVPLEEWNAEVEAKRSKA